MKRPLQIKLCRAFFGRVADQSRFPKSQSKALGPWVRIPPSKYHCVKMLAIFRSSQFLEKVFYASRDVLIKINTTISFYRTKIFGHLPEELSQLLKKDHVPFFLLSLDD